MKLVYILLMFTFLQTAKGQDYCKLIKKEVFDDKKTFEYTSPYDVKDKPSLRVTRNFNADPEFGFDNFFLNFRIEGSIDSIYQKNADGGQTEKEDKAITVEFEDKSRIVDEAIRINHDMSDDRTLAVWYLDFPLTEKNLKDFTSKKIVKFSLAGNNQMVAADSANSIQHYIQCIKEIKMK